MSETLICSRIKAISLTTALLTLVSCGSPHDRNAQKALEAAKSKNWSEAIHLVEKGVTLNAIDKEGYTLLHLSNDPDLTRLLVLKGHDVNQQSGGMYSEETKKGAIATEKSLAKISSKIEYDASRETDPFYGENLAPLHVIKNPDVIKILLDAGANPNAVSAYGISPISEVRSLEALVHLLSAGADMRNSNYGKTPLKSFLDNNRYQEFKGGEEAYFSTIKLFIEAGVDVNHADNGDFTALHSASYKVSPIMLKYLLENGANPRLNTAGYGGAFCFSIKESHNKILQAYLEHDIQLLFIKCGENQTVLQYARQEAKFKSTHTALTKTAQLVLERARAQESQE